jgi:hypothetical protein
MALQTVYSDTNGLTLTSPNNNANALNYFGLDVSYNSPPQETITWHHPATDGDSKKKMGTRGKSGTITGFLEGATARSEERRVGKEC